MWDSFEEAYEYDVSMSQIIDDSLPISIESTPGTSNMYNFNYWKFLGNDTLFWSHETTMTWLEDRIPSEAFWTLDDPVEFDSSIFQPINSLPSEGWNQAWEQVSDLEIVRLYRTQNPTSRIGISRTIIWEYDPELSFSYPTEKHLLFMVK